MLENRCETVSRPALATVLIFSPISRRCVLCGGRRQPLPGRFVLDVGDDLRGAVRHFVGQALQLFPRRRSLFAHQLALDRRCGEGRRNAGADGEPDGAEQQRLPLQAFRQPGLNGGAVLPARGCGRIDPVADRRPASAAASTALSVSGKEMSGTIDATESGDV